jgi:ABC-2 type transport system permease protein
VSLSAEGGVPSEVDVLLVVKPKGLGETELFNLDQYLMRGGRIVLCAGNYEADLGAQGLTVVPIDTGLDGWLAHHGLRVGKSLVLDDQNQPLPIPEVRNTMLGAMRTLRLEPYPYLVQVLDDGFGDPDITATLDSVGIYWGSPIEIVTDDNTSANIETIPILSSSDRSWTSDDLSQVAFVDYVVPEETEPRLLSVALAGKFRSYYTDRPVPGAEADAEPTDDGEVGAEETPAPPIALIESPATRLVLVGNAEFLSDFVATIISQVDPNLFVENLRFIENVIDWITLDNDMMGIRSRGMVSRRLDREDVKSEVAIEAVNYLLPALGLLAIGLVVRTRRRQAVEASARAVGEEMS